MFEIKELSDTELNAYLDSIMKNDKEYQEHQQSESIIKYYIEKIQDANKRCENIQKRLRKIEKVIRDKNFDESYNQCIAVSNSLGNLSQDLRVLPSKFGCTNELTSYSVADDNYPIEFFYMEDILKIVLPEILPHRLRINDNDNRLVTMQNYAFNKQRIYNKFAKEFEYGKFKIYDERVVLFFNNIYTDAKFFIDSDNVDTKIITDIIASYVLIDDNPMWCSHYVSAEIGDNNHSEVYVIPESKFLQFLQERKK